MHAGGFELTKLTYTRLEDNLIHHQGDRLMEVIGPPFPLELQQCSFCTRVNRLMLVSLCAETIKPVFKGDKM